jgi:RNA polymerase sigma-70 factor (ECF subfamily)
MGLDEQDIRDFLGAEYRRLVAGLTLLAESQAIAEEAVQEALGRAWERTERAEHIEHLVGWVAVVAANILRSALRRRLAERRARGRLGRAGHGLTDTMAAVDERADVARAIAALPHRQRQITVLHYFADLSIADIAAGLRMNENAVKGALHRARRSLARALGEHESEEADDMPGVDNRVRRTVEWLSGRVDPLDAFDRVLIRKNHRRTMRRLGMAALTVVVLAGTAGRTLALARVFAFGQGIKNPTVEPAPNVSATPPAPSPAQGPSPAPGPSPPSVGRGCDASRVVGDFSGDFNLDVATVARTRCLGPGQGGSPAPEWSLDVRWGPVGENGQSTEGVFQLPECRNACRAIGPVDVDGNGTAELGLVAQDGSFFETVEILELPASEAGPQVWTVAPPGAPGHPAGKPARFALGSSLRGLAFLSCRTTAAGHVVVASAALRARLGTIWQVHETAFSANGQFTFEQTRDYTLPYDPNRYRAVPVLPASPSSSPGRKLRSRARARSRWPGASRGR